MDLTPLGDQAVLAAFTDEAKALEFAASVRAAAFAGVVDVVSAYLSVAVFYDLTKTRYSELVPLLRRVTQAKSQVANAEGAGRRYRIPCCYELGPDLPSVSERTGLPFEEVIALHSAVEYTVYAIGFCPGFPYLGYLPRELCGVPRLASPRLRVDPGSVGLTDRQTGIYPLERPGGWNLIGRTPLEIVQVADGYFPLRPGDKIQFERIDEAEFQRLRGQRL